MPAVNPTPGDLIEVTLFGKHNTPTVMLAEIKTKENSGKWQVELGGTPPMRGMVSMDQYEWKPEFGRWTQKPQTKPETPTKLKLHPSSYSQGDRS